MADTLTAGHRRDEWFPKEGYGKSNRQPPVLFRNQLRFLKTVRWMRIGWFLAIVSVVVLPSPTVYFYYKDTHSVTGTRWTNASTTVGSNDGFEENPLATASGQSDVYDIEGSEPPNAPPAQVKLAKMQREAKDMREQNQTMQTEIASLKAIATTKDESTKVRALQAQNAEKDNTIAALKAQLAQRPQADGLQLSEFRGELQAVNAPLQQAVAKTKRVTVKELAADESLSEKTRESAKLALDELALDELTQVMTLGVLPGEEMAQYLRSLRLLHYAAVVIRVAGRCVGCLAHHTTTP
jgi:hypothetical protein